MKFGHFCPILGHFERGFTKSYPIFGAQFVKHLQNRPLSNLKTFINPSSLIRVGFEDVLQIELQKEYNFFGKNRVPQILESRIVIF